MKASELKKGMVIDIDARKVIIKALDVQSPSSRSGSIRPHSWASRQSRPSPVRAARASISRSSAVRRSWSRQSQTCMASKACWQNSSQASCRFGIGFKLRVNG